MNEKTELAKMTTNELQAYRRIIRGAVCEKRVVLNDDESEVDEALKILRTVND